jgi:SAM-dependent methyltransferase
MPAFDYSRIADVYDDFVRFDDDIDFFTKLAAESRGPVLELMVGTGRLTRPLAETGIKLIGVDSSLDMLEVCRQKLRRGGHLVQLVGADVTSLPIGNRFDLVLWPFNGISELISEAEQSAALEGVRRLLAPDGCFVCTLHNPPVRLATVDGSWRTLGSWPLESRPGSVVLSSRLQREDGSLLISGEQRVEFRDEAGDLVDKRTVPIRFSLLAREEFEGLSKEAGFAVRQLLGDYSGEGFEEDTSPFMIWVLEPEGG